MPARTSQRDREILRLHGEGMLGARIAQAVGVSPGQVSRVLIAHGARTNGRRADAGVRRKPIPEATLAAALALKQSMVAKPDEPGKAVAGRLASGVAIRELESRGMLAAGAVKPAQLNRVLREDFGLRQRGAEAKRGGPGVVRRFEAARANHRFQFDGTPLGAFYIDARGDLAYHADTDAKAARKEAGKSIASVLAFVDDHSRCVRFGVYDGETTRNVLDFARRTFTRSADPQEPFCGLPSVVYADNGSGANSHLAREAWRRLGVSLVTHRPHAAWGKGKIEAAFKRTRSYQELTRGQPFTTYEQANSFVRAVALELNNTPMAALGGRTPNQVWLESVADGLAVAPSEPALWRRLAATRVDGCRVAPDLTIAVGEGETIALPMRRPFVDWIGQRVAVYLDTKPGGLVREGDASNYETLFVEAPERSGANASLEFEVPRVRPQVYRSVLTAPVEDTAAQLLLAQARLAVERGAFADRLMGEWIGQRAPLFDLPHATEADLAQHAARGTQRSGPVEMVDAHAAKRELLAAGWEIDPALIARLFTAPGGAPGGADSIERSRLDHFLTTGELPPEHAARGTQRAAVEEEAA